MTKIFVALKEAKRNHPDLFALFLFGITVAVLDLLQIVVLLFYAFR